jgi:spore cortex formation protein SpoVR/YcgB (stage V sporulation)
MFTIQPQNPSIQKYITDIGQEQVEQMILAYLEIKAKFHNSSKEEENKPNYKTLGISDELHKKLLALKSSSKKSNRKMSEVREEISTKFKDDYAHKSIEDIRDEYFISKGYL